MTLTYEIVADDRVIDTWEQYIPGDSQYFKYCEKDPSIIAAGFKVGDLCSTFRYAHNALLFSFKNKYGDLCSHDKDAVKTIKYTFLRDAILNYAICLDLSWQVIWYFILPSNITFLMNDCYSELAGECYRDNVYRQLDCGISQHEDKAKRIKEILTSFDNSNEIKKFRRLYNYLKHRGDISLKDCEDPNNTLCATVNGTMIDLLKRDQYSIDELQDLVWEYNCEFESYFNKLIAEIFPEGYLNNKISLIDSINASLAMYKAQNSSNKMLKNRIKKKIVYTINDLKKYINEINLSNNTLNSKKIVLFGSGRLGELVKYRLAQAGIKVLFYVDNDKNKWGKYIDNIKIISPEELKKGDLFVIVTVDSMYLKQIKNQLDDLKAEYIYYGDLVVKNRIDQVEEVYNSLDDNESKRVYVNAIMHDLRAESCADIYSANQYFCLSEFMDLNMTHQVFVDCGANVGKTSEEFVKLSDGIFDRIYTFEPTMKNNLALKKRMSRVLDEYALDSDKIVSENAFVGEKNKKQNLKIYTNDGTGNRRSSNNTGTTEVQQYSLDTYFNDRTDTPTFIKADIEGAEGDMIEGARNIIKNHSPLLGICIYHSFYDLIELPLKIKSINPNYRMAIRHHSVRSWETVLYCY